MLGLTYYANQHFLLDVSAQTLRLNAGFIG